jgi:hypothetical protein
MQVHDVLNGASLEVVPLVICDRRLHGARAMVSNRICFEVVEDKLFLLLLGELLVDASRT